MSNKNNLYTSMYLCDNFDVETNSAKGILDKICTNDGLCADFSIAMHVKYIVPENSKPQNFIWFLFLQNDKKLKKIFEFEIPDKDQDIDRYNLFGVNRVIEFDDYEFPEKGNYFWKLFVIPEGLYKANFNKEEKIDVLKLFKFLTDNDCLENMINLKIE